MSVNQEEQKKKKKKDKGKKKKTPAFLLFSHNPIVFQSEGNPVPISKTNCFNNKAAGGVFFNEKGGWEICADLWQDYRNMQSNLESFKGLSAICSQELSTFL